MYHQIILLSLISTKTFILPYNSPLEPCPTDVFHQPSDFLGP